MVPLILTLTESGNSHSNAYTGWIWRQSLQCLHWLNLVTVHPMLTLTTLGDGPSDKYIDWVWRRSLWFLHWLILGTVPLILTLTESGDGPFDTYTDLVWRRPLGLILPPPWGWHEGWWGQVSVQERPWWCGRREETWCGGPVVHGGLWWELPPQTGGWKRECNYLLSMSDTRLSITYSLWAAYALETA